MTANRQEKRTKKRCPDAGYLFVYLLIRFFKWRNDFRICKEFQTAGLMNEVKNLPRKEFS